MIAALETRALSFSFSGAQAAVHDISLEVPQGAAYGILGPNGAGKSTLMKLMLGLLKPGSGTVRVWGQRTGEKQDLFRRIGALIEEPRLYTQLSGRENLELFATYRRLPVRRVEEVLQQTGMEELSRRRVGHYSTGMRQRLGIALALLPDPDLLFLDEPTNGLDPQGIAEVRQLVQRLHREQGKTILFSSHILTEVEQICSHVAILHRGRLRFQGSLDALQGGEVSRRRLLIETGGSAAALKVLAGRPELAAEAPDEANIRLLIRSREDIPALIDQLRIAGISIFQVRLAEERLEDSFLNLLRED